MKLLVPLVAVMLLAGSTVGASDITIQEVDPDTNQPIGAPFSPGAKNEGVLHGTGPSSHGAVKAAQQAAQQTQATQTAATQQQPVHQPAAMHHVPVYADSPFGYLSPFAGFGDLQRQLHDTPRMLNLLTGPSWMDNFRMQWPSAFRHAHHPQLAVGSNGNAGGSNAVSNFGDQQQPLSTEIRPLVDIVEKDTEYTFHIELPGVKQEDVHVELRGNTLIFSGKKSARRETGAPGSMYHSVESSSGYFRRAFALPKGVDADNITADYHKNGIVDIRIPKKEPTRSRKINLNLLNTQ